MGDSKKHLAEAVTALNASDGVQVVDASPLYFTEPQGVKEQAWFCNQVLRLSCAPSWTAKTFLEHMLHLEAQLGRSRDGALRYGPRVIDMDLLLFGHSQCQESVCTVPHPRLQERAFVLIPLRHVLQQDTLFTSHDLEKSLKNLSYSVQEDKIFQ